MSYRPTQKQLVHARNQIQLAMAQLTDDVIDTLYRQARYVASGDGFKATTNGSDGGSSGHNASSPTESAALAKTVPDPTGQLIAELWALVTGPMFKAANRVTDVRIAIETVGTSIKGRVNTVELCAECDQPCVKGHRLDGQMYCDPGGCYFRAWRKRAKANGAPVADVDEFHDKMAQARSHLNADQG